jgi:predicted CXXCH cytochrome family protein
MRFARVVLLGLCLSVAASVPVVAIISGSAHDFSSASWNSSGEICIVCHAPHGGIALSDAPLWNHSLTTQNFTLYSSPTVDAADMSQPAGTTRLCLSCHDGTIPLDSFGGASGTNFESNPIAAAGDLNSEHPVSFTYDDVLATADGGLYPPSTTTSGLGGTIADDLLFNSKVECSSCHDVHNALGTGGHLLVKSNAGSGLCLTCHAK